MQGFFLLSVNPNTIFLRKESRPGERTTNSNMFDDAFGFDALLATDIDTGKEARSVVTYLFSSFSKKEKKQLSLLREIEDLGLRCERLRKFFAGAIGERVASVTAAGTTYTFRYKPHSLLCTCEDWTEWVSYRDACGVLATADLTSGKKSSSAAVTPSANPTIPAPSFDFEDDFWDWSDFVAPSLTDSVKVSDVAASETVKAPTIGNFRGETLAIPKNKTEKVSWNLDAIRTLKSIEGGIANLSKETQEILARYSGWGGAAKVFDEDCEEFAAERKLLKDLLTEDEYESALQSTVSSFYTEPWMVQLIYKTLQRFGFHGGNILDPSMGVGNFFRFMPDELMQNSRLYGVELDSITGRIAKMLFPNARITISGFENCDYQVPDCIADVVTSNCPFGNFRVFSPKFGNKFLVHDFFFAEALEKCRPGGIVAFITSKGTLDKRDAELRKYMAAHSVFLGAIRLPSEAFVSYGGADVTTDIIFFQKKAPETVEQCFVETVPFADENGFVVDDVFINEYFVSHPDMVLGKLVTETGRFGSSVTLSCSWNASMEQLPIFAEQVATKIEAVYEDAEIRVSDDGSVCDRIPYETEMNVRNYTYAFLNGMLYYREDAYLYTQNVKKTEEKRITYLCRVRDCLRNLLQMQVDGCSDAQFDAGARELNRVYDDAVRNIGFISSRANALAFRDDADYPLLCSLEVIDPEDEGNVSKSEIFAKRSVQPRLVLREVETADEAIRCSLAECGRLDPAVMASVYNPYGEEIRGAEYMDKIAEEVPELLYRDPENHNLWTLADEYLSGNVRRKYSLAKAAGMERNVLALQAVLPTEIPASAISVQIGTPWIRLEDYTNFLLDSIVKSTSYWVRREVRVVYSEELSLYDVECIRYIKSMFSCGEHGLGTRHMSAPEIFLDALNNVPVVVRYKHFGEDKASIDQDETVEAREKLAKMQRMFQEWIFSDDARRSYYEQYYNEHFNCNVLRRYDGSNLTFPGINPSIVLRNYQRNAVARIQYAGSTLLAHAVGAGKTYTMVASIMELRRLGLVKKPVMIVPKSLLLQTSSEFLRLYPGANVIVASDRDFEKSRRQRFIARIATSSSFDCVIMTHDQFSRIPVSKELREARIRKQVDLLTEALSAEERTGGRSFTKRLALAKKNLISELTELQSKAEDSFLSFELLGIDQIVVDEAHLFKNLRFFSHLQCAGINSNASKRAEDLKLKTEYLNEKRGYRSVVFATGTPISNTISELYVMTEYLRPDLHTALGLTSFDRWVGQFGQVMSELELSVAGQFQVKDRLSRFQNLPELTMLFHQYADVMLSQDLPIERPKLRGGSYSVVETQMDDYAEEVTAEFIERAERIHNGNVDPKEDNFLKIANDARKLCADNRLIDAEAPDNIDGKIGHMIENVVAEYHRFDNIGFPSVQIVFCDMGTPDGSQFNLYADMKEKMVLAGIPNNEIVFVHDAKTDAQRVALFKAVDAAKYRVLIGSTTKCGLGCNIQSYLVAAHILTCPWKPSELEQAIGRIIRYGNHTPGGEVSVYQYIQQGGFDAFNWATIERKQRFISSIMLNKNLDRTCEDVDEESLNYATFKMIATGDDTVLRQMKADNEVKRLRLLKQRWQEQKRDLLRDYQVTLPEKIIKLERNIAEMESDEEDVKNLPPEDAWELIIDDETKVVGASEIGVALSTRIEKLPYRDFDGEFLGNFGPFKLIALRAFTSGSENCVEQMILVGNHSYPKDLMKRPEAILARLRKILEEIPSKIEAAKRNLEDARLSLESAKREYDKPFEYEDALFEAERILREINAGLLAGAV